MPDSGITRRQALFGIGGILTAVGSKGCSNDVQLPEADGGGDVDGATAPPDMASNPDLAEPRTGIVAWYTGGFLGQMGMINPVVPIADFFNDCKNGTLPHFAIIDPDFQGADDHPSHDILKGQVYVASIYKALAESPQWKRTLFVITYDEHGGFYDHVAPPTVPEDNAEFQQLGFRVPSFVIGGMVKKGHVSKTVYDHCSVGATLKTRYGIATLNQRMSAANDLADCIDPALVQSPSPPPPGMPTPPMMKWSEALDRVGPWSQEELADINERRIIPRSEIDSRSARETTVEWLTHAQRLGVVRMRLSDRHWR